VTPHPGPLPGGERGIWFVAKSERTGGAGRPGAVVRDAMRCNEIGKRRVAFTQLRSKAQCSAYATTEASAATPALSPLRFDALLCSRCVGGRSRLSPINLWSIALVFNLSLRAFQAIFFGLLFFWASKRKVTRASADDRNARCVSGTLATTRQSKTDASRSRPAPG
jgi:hypothetical protein